MNLWESVRDRVRDELAHQQTQRAAEVVGGPRSHQLDDLCTRSAWAGRARGQGEGEHVSQKEPIPVARCTGEQAVARIEQRRSQC